MPLPDVWSPFEAEFEAVYQSEKERSERRMRSMHTSGPARTDLNSVQPEGTEMVPTGTGAPFSDGQGVLTSIEGAGEMSLSQEQRLPPKSRASPEKRKSPEKQGHRKSSRKPGQKSVRESMKGEGTQ